jgi:ABC-type dipeptide/oligopeptide/nickel transport system permease component
MSISPKSVRGSLLFVLRRVIASAITLLVLAITVFLMIKAIPGDEAHVAAGESATPEQVALTRTRLGLDRPLIDQLFRFLGRLLHGDLGNSIATHRSVSDGIVHALPQTLELVVLASILMVALVGPAAVLAAQYQERSMDLGVRFTVITAAALPSFWLALELQNLLAAKLGIFPISGELTRGYTVQRHTGSVLIDSLLGGSLPDFSNALQHLLLPAFVLMLPFAGQLFRATRAELVAVLSRDHITVARAKGMTNARLMRRHALPNALGPAITVIGIEFGNMVGAAVLVETVFGLNGLGSYLTTAVAQKDTFAVLGGVLVVGVVVVLTNLVVDIIQLIRDPRIRSAQIGA